MNLRYLIAIHDSAYNYNIEQNFHEFGHFTTERRGVSKQITVNGELKITHLHIYLNLYYDDSAITYQPLFGTITGILNNGLTITIGPRYKILDNGHGEKFPIEKYLVHSVQISDSDTKYTYNMLGHNKVINIGNNHKVIFKHYNYHWFIYLSGLSKWAYYQGKTLLNHNKFLNLGTISHKDQTYSCGILFFNSEYKSINNISKLTTKQAVIKISSNFNADISDITYFAKKFCGLFSIFMNEFVIVSNIIKIIGNNVHNVLFNKLNGGVNKLPASSLDNTFYFHRMRKYMTYTEIATNIRRFLTDYHKLKPIINSFMSDFNRGISNEDNLEECVDGIGSYFNGERYKTNNKPMSLTSKLSNCFMWKFSKDIQTKVLGMTDNKRIKDYAQKIADTRNNLIHHDSKYEGNVIKNYPLNLRRLHCLVTCYILKVINVPTELIRDYVENTAPFK